MPRPVIRPASRPARVVVLVSGTGSLLEALLEAATDPAYGARVVAVGADRDGIAALDHARQAGVPTYVRKVHDFPERAAWDRALAAATASYRPDLVVSAGFMKIVGEVFLDRFADRYINTHPALLPSFPGAHPVRDALAYGVRVSGGTLHVVDAGVDTGPVIAQRAVEVRDGDDELSLHERIKAVERVMLVEHVGKMAREGWSVEGRRVSIP